MAYTSIDEFIKQLECEGELIRITEFCDPKLVIAEITDRVSKMPGGGKALLFENTGTDYPVLINAMGSLKRICLALGVDDLEDIRHEIEDLFALLSSPKPTLWDKLKMLPELGKVAAWMPKLVKGNAPCQEIVDKTPDLSKIPILKCWPADGGKFVTFPMVITRDPLTGIRNVGMYRMQVFGNDVTGMHWHKHKTGARHYEEYKRLGRKMPVSVAIGGDPAHTFSATAPLPDNIDEYMLSGFLRKKKVELIKCIINDLEVPVDADFVLEGYVDPQEELAWEGPFGDHTGFYSLPDFYPKFHVTCITSKKKAVFPATIVGVPPMEDAYIGKATERIFLAPIQLAMVPELHDMDMPFAGVAHNLVIISFDKTFPGQGLKVMNALWGAGQMMFNKVLVAVDRGVDVHDYARVLRSIAQHVDVRSDVFFGRGPLDVLDHSSSKKAYGGKMFVDATTKFDEERIGALQNSGNSADVAECLRQCSPVADFCFPFQETASFVFVSIDKAKTTVDALSQCLNASGIASLCMAVVVLDAGIDLCDLHHAMWIILNNIDPQRDYCFLGDSADRCILLDATAKRIREDQFERDWPNIVTSSPETIAQVDKMWNRLEVGAFVDSPSSKFFPLLKNNGAFAEKQED